MHIITNIENINRPQWEQLVAESSVATWFQTPEAYDFFASLPNILTPFVVALVETPFCASPSTSQSIKGLVVGYITKDKNPIHQFFTRRAIIMGGPLLAEDITTEELTTLLNALRTFQPSNLHTLKPIYLESRNFNDYSRWRNTFEACVFTYQPHLNFHIDTTSEAIIKSNLGRGRRREIKIALQQGAQIIEHPTLQQVRDYYAILANLYRTKIHLPLFPWEFFEQLYTLSSAHFLLIAQDNKVIGGTVCMELREKCIYEWYACGEDETYRQCYPSTMGTYAGMLYAALHGMSRFDMMGAGKPTEGYGVRDFKRQFGGTLVEHGRFLHIHSPLLYKLGTLGVRLMKRL